MAKRETRLPGGRRRERERYIAYRERHFASRGIVALLLGVISLLVMALLVLWSIWTGAGAGQSAGAVGIGAFYLACLGLWMGLKSFGDRCRSYAMSKVGTIFCAVMAALWFLLLCWGLAH